MRQGLITPYCNYYYIKLLCYNTYTIIYVSTVDKNALVFQSRELEKHTKHRNISQSLCYTHTHTNTHTHTQLHKFYSSFLLYIISYRLLQTRRFRCQFRQTPRQHRREIVVVLHQWCNPNLPIFHVNALVRLSSRLLLGDLYVV